MRSGTFLSMVAITATLADRRLFAWIRARACKRRNRAAICAAVMHPQPTTVDIQGADEWKRSPHMRAYYDATVATFANGTDIDVDAYEARSFAIFREFARANGMNEQGMIDHLKLIPRQVVGIVKEDPAVLEELRRVLGRAGRTGLRGPLLRRHAKLERTAHARPSQSQDLEAGSFSRVSFRAHGRKQEHRNGKLQLQAPFRHSSELRDRPLGSCRIAHCDCADFRIDIGSGRAANPLLLARLDQSA